jgi:hypothetical protein
MNYRKPALVLAVIRGLLAHGSWTGKTHVQKSVFLLKTTSQIDVPFTYMLYKHGPYSFEVESELEQMRSYAAVKSEPDPEGYGVVLKPGPGAEFVGRVARLNEFEEAQVERVCRFVGKRNVADLERLATAAWIRINEGVAESQRIAARLNQLKPHVSLREAEAANDEFLAFLTDGGLLASPDPIA